MGRTKALRLTARITTWTGGVAVSRTWPRADILDEAKELITGSRNDQYGPATGDFSRSANALNAYGYRGPGGRELSAYDIAIMITAVKISRLMWRPDGRDNWVDIAGYAACGYECAEEEMDMK